MPYYTKTQVAAKITETEDAISKVMSAQSYQTAGGMVTQRAQLKTLRDTLQFWLDKWEQLDTEDSGGIFTRAQFNSL